MGMCELSRTPMYDDAHLNVLEKALPIPNRPHKQRNWKKKRNPKCRNYDSMDLARLPQTLSKIYFFVVGGHVIIKCPQIDNEMKDGFVRHEGQQKLDKDSGEKP